MGRVKGKCRKLKLVDASEGHCLSVQAFASFGVSTKVILHTSLEASEEVSISRAKSEPTRKGEWKGKADE